MLEHRRLVGRLKATAVGFLVLVPSVALAGAKDAPATKLANDAMQTDYAGTHFKKAEQKLKKAITLCGASACAYDVVGRLHRDLAIVYIAGLKQKGKGKAELKKALEANPDLPLDNDFATPEVRQAFKAAGGKEKVDEEPEASPTAKKDDDCEPGSEGCDKEPKKEDAEPAAPSKFPKNWLSVHFDQDFLLYSAKDNVCASYAAGRAEADQYACFQAGTQFGHASGQDIVPGAGNHVSGGVGRATSRILVGFDRLLSSNVSLGLRLGFAFGGGPTTIAGAKFMPFHGELRANYWFGTDPFESSGLRPYVSLSGGLAEVDGHVSVEYYKSADANSKATLDAWRKTGKGFAGLGFGVMIPIGSSGIIPEVRAKAMLGSAAPAFDLALGYAFGF